MEVRVEKENDIGFDGNAVEKDGLRRRVEGVRHESRLNHNQRVVHILRVQDMSKYGERVRTSTAAKSKSGTDR